jgi:hypothetical protein
MISAILSWVLLLGGAVWTLGMGALAVFSGAPDRVVVEVAIPGVVAIALGIAIMVWG